MLGKEVTIQICHLTNETTCVRGGYNSSGGRDPLKEILYRKLKIKTLHYRVFLGSKLCAFGLCRSERDFEMSFMVSNGLPSVKMPLLFEYSAFESRIFAFKMLTFSLPCLFSLTAGSSSSLSLLQLLPWKTQWRKELQ